MKLTRMLSLAGVIITGTATTALAADTGGPWKLGDIVVEQAWARVVPGAKSGAVYLTVHNKSGQDDLLLAVDSSAARSTAVHQSTVTEGVASMSPVPGGITLPTHGEVTMRPGGMHIMLSGIAQAVKPGETLPVKMVFRDAGSLEFDVPVVPLGSADPTEKHLKH